MAAMQAGLWDRLYACFNDYEAGFDVRQARVDAGEQEIALFIGHRVSSYELFRC